MLEREDRCGLLTGSRRTAVVFDWMPPSRAFQRSFKVDGDSRSFQGIGGTARMVLRLAYMFSRARLHLG